MKKLKITSLLIVLGFSTSFAQSTASMFCKWGFSFQKSSDNKFLIVTEVMPGSLADLSELRVGDEIFQIDSHEISNMSNSANMFDDYSGTIKKLKILRFGQFGDLDIPTISEISNINEYLTEGMLYLNIKTRENEEYDFKEYYFKGLAIQILSDKSIDLSKYKSYNFEYSDTINPLEEKELSDILDLKLTKLGLKRTKDTPDLIVKVINHYNANNYDNYVELRFSDAKGNSDSKLPLVVWKASMNLKVEKKDIFYFYENFFDIVLYQFPVIFKDSPQRIISDNYRYTGIIYDKSNMKIVLFVLPSSPAALAGIQKGDKILSIDGESYPSKYSELINIEYQTVLSSEKAVSESAKKSGHGLRYLQCCQEYIWPIKFNCGESYTRPIVFKISRDNKKIELQVIPIRKRIISILD